MSPERNFGQRAILEKALRERKIEHLTPTEFRAIYKQRSKEFTGLVPTPGAIAEEYLNYLTIVGFEGSAGTLTFEKEGDAGMTWYFTRVSPARSSGE